MSKKPTNHGKEWSDKDVSQLKKLAAGNTPTGLLGYKLGRTENSVRGKASEIGLSLKPTNQSPYNRRKQT